jgi:uncharacterized protein YfaS (alpha-2-macroglobulin family)
MPSVYTSLRLFRLAVLAVVTLIAAPSAHADSGNLSVTLHGNTLAVDIHFHAAHTGHGKLTIDVLDPSDRVLGHSERNADVPSTDGQWQQDVTLAEPMSFEDLVWQRVRYRFQFDSDPSATIEDIASISQVLRRPVVHILGQSSYFTGGKAAVRVVVTDTDNHPLASNGHVRIELLDPDHPAVALFAAHLNSRATVDAQFRFPANLTGNYQLHYIVDTPLGSAEYTQPIHLEDKASILLTTEKPLYQPGQAIHARVLALERADHHAAANQPLIFEVEDSRGNKVFKRITHTDAFGVASAEFQLADEVNLGTYHLRALMGESADTPTNTAELAFNVDRYVLPKFKVAIDFTRANGKPKLDYRPGDHVTGIIHANYFFGKPVDDAELQLKASSADVAIFDVHTTNGRTDKDGAYHFDIKLPSYFAGHPLSQGTARVLLEATVKDSAGHSETRGDPITITESSLLVTAVPEGGQLIPGLDNLVYILTSYPDGTPASTTLNVHLPPGDRFIGEPDQQLTTGPGGVAIAHVIPGPRLRSVTIDADDGHGNRTSTSVPLETRNGTDQVLLRADRALYRAGDRIQLDVFSSKQRGAAYIDVVKDGQTILTLDIDLEGGRATLSLTATPEMSGALDFSAYIFSRSAQAVADHRLVFVQPADELHIETIADAASYLPGAEARIHFHVTNAHGQGVAAALGLQIVDEAVFALAEKQPGFAKVFFYLEQEAMKPRYEIHSLSMNDVVEPASAIEGQQRDLDTRVLFSATELARPNQVNTEFGRTIPQEKYAEYLQQYRDNLVDQVHLISNQLSEAYEKDPATNDPVKVFTHLTNTGGSRLHDAWGTNLRLEPIGGWGSRSSYYTLRSAGPDRRFNTADDLAVTVLIRAGSVLANPGARSFDLKLEHDRGPMNGLTEILGSVIDPTGAVIPGATIEAREQTTHSVRHTTSTATGDFDLAALAPGRYDVRITAPGFETSSREITLEPRDRAILSASLQVGAVTEAVMVEDMAMALPAPKMAMRGEGMGRAAGVMGGMVADGSTLDVVTVSAAQLEILPVNSRNAALLTAAPAAPHVRSYFPEALYINPEILTDAGGNASITVPLADSITTWRMAMLASTQSGALGSATSSLKVFQDFFVDLDLPVTLTQGDRISIPVAVYNYAGKRGDVSLTLQQDDWFSLVDDTATKSLAVDPDRVGSSQFTVQANRIGKFKLTLSARMDGDANHQDVVVREIEVVPNGQQQNIVFNGHLDTSAAHTITFPASSIPDASKIFVRLYPGPLSQVIEGMDSILQMPGGCFEQTSSSTYPNVLALDYMKRTKKLTPEVHAKAEGYIANGYQRLLTFEVPGGGFSWFGQAPANKILTAYGLMEFSDMAKVYDVDPRLIERTSNWLAQQQQPDGSWKPDTYFINEGATNRYNHDVLRITAYIAWSLANTGYRGPALDKAREYIASHLDDSTPDAYTLAVLANFAVDDAAHSSNQDSARDFTAHIMQRLLDARKEDGDKISWSTAETSVYSTGASASIETTGLATQALLKWGQATPIARKALNFLTSTKQASGTWGTTQATIMALRSLLLASEASGADATGTASIRLNDKVVQTLELTPENNDLFQQFVLPGIDPHAANAITIDFSGKGGLAYQVVGRYFTPWPPKTLNPTVPEPLTINVTYDRTHLAQNDIATATATIRNNRNATANMVMVDLGIPPGFDLLSEDLQDFQDKSPAAKPGHLEKFSMTATQAILYFNALSPEQTLTLHFRLRAKYPIRAKNFESKVYEYYDPAVNAIASPIQFEVEAR